MVTACLFAPCVLSVADEQLRFFKRKILALDMALAIRVSASATPRECKRFRLATCIVFLASSPSLDLLLLRVCMSVTELGVAAWLRILEACLFWAEGILCLSTLSPGARKFARNEDVEF